MYIQKRWPEGTWMRLRSRDVLIALMKQNNMSYKQLGDYSDCHKSFISHLTSGRRSSCKQETAKLIAAALKVPVEVIFDPCASITSMSNDKKKAPAA